jgi:hypothetical protein
MLPTEIDLTPLPILIHAVRQQGLSLYTCLCEFFDNSYDAGATTIRLTWDPDGNCLEIEDNGQGCADVSKMLRIADRQEHGTTMLGRYGVGVKDASITLGERIDILTRHDGVETRLTCDWAALERQRHWHIPGPVSMKTTKPNGTGIRIQRLFKDCTNDWDGLLATLGLAYTRVRPGVWKKALGLTRDKEQTRLRAMQLYPGADLRRKKDHGRAEALLLARWGSRLRDCEEASDGWAV